MAVSSTVAMLSQPASLGADFNRLGVDFWLEVEALNPKNKLRKAELEFLNEWRNAIAHQSFDPRKLGGIQTLQLRHVRRWRTACDRLANSFDLVMRGHLHALTGAHPW